MNPYNMVSENSFPQINVLLITFTIQRGFNRHRNGFYFKSDRSLEYFSIHSSLNLKLVPFKSNQDNTSILLNQSNPRTPSISPRPKIIQNLCKFHHKHQQQRMNSNFPFPKLQNTRRNGDKNVNSSKIQIIIFPKGNTPSSYQNKHQSQCMKL